MKILITGCAGLIGSRMADWLAENHHGIDVIGIDDLSGGYIENVHSKVNFISMNLSEDDINWVFARFQPDVVYHFAAYAAEGLSPFIRTYNYKNNLISTVKIINACIKYDAKRLVFTSSMAVYGNGENGKRPFDESDRPSPIDPYGIAKFAAEMDIQIAGIQHGLDWCIIRPHNIYGIKQNIWDKYRNVLGIWMYQHLNGQPMTIFGDGTQTRAFSYIDDCLGPLWRAGTIKESSREIINLGGTYFYSINEANHLLMKVMGGGTVQHLEQRHEVKDAYPTWQKSIDLLGYNEKTMLEEGLSNMWVWAKTQPMRERRIWNQYEVDKGIYGFWKLK